MTEDPQRISSKIQEAVDGLSKLAIWAIAGCVVLVLIFMYLEATHDINTSYWPHIVGKFGSSLLLNLMPVLIVAAVTKPIYDRVVGAQVLLLEQAEKTAARELIRTEIALVREALEKSFRALEKQITHSWPIVDFFPTFNDTNWGSMFSAAKSVDLCAFYWSTEWMSKNVPFLRQAVLDGCNVRIYLPSPTNYSNEFLAGGIRSQKTKERIIDSVATLRHQIGADSSAVEIYLVHRSINYMLARIEYAGGQRRFLLSPFRNSDSNLAGRPPVVVLDETKATAVLRDFIEGEMDHLRRTATPMPNLGVSKYVTWADDGSRVVVSSHLACSAPCKFCYVESVKEGNEKAVSDRAMLGLYLAYDILRDQKFRRGPNGTVLMLGGLADPFFKDNTQITIEFLRALNAQQVGNPIHIATRFCIKDEIVMQELAQMDRLIVNYSVCTIRDGIEFSQREILKRFDDAKLLRDAGVRVGLYIRPVIPGVTKEDLPEILRQAREAGIKVITVGGLWADERITRRLGVKEVSVGKRKGNARRMFMDRNGSMAKLNMEEVEEVRQLAKDEGFEVFGSSFALSQDVLAR